MGYRSSKNESHDHDVKCEFDSLAKSYLLPLKRKVLGRLTFSYTDIVVF